MIATGSLLRVIFGDQIRCRLNQIKPKQKVIRWVVSVPSENEAYF